jgi:hypothetical protein
MAGNTIDQRRRNYLREMAYGGDRCVVIDRAHSDWHRSQPGDQGLHLLQVLFNGTIGGDNPGGTPK